MSEFLTFSTGWVREGSALLPGLVRLVASDTGDSWLVTEDGARQLALLDGAAAAAASADTTVSGTASDLLLGLYRRSASSGSRSPAT